MKAFYEAVLPSEGQYALFTLSTKRHVWAPNIDALVAETEQRVDEQGVYFATASFAEPTSRTQANVRALRSLRLDIDAGEAKFARNPEGSYPSQRDAVVALAGFLKATSLSASFVVSSGEGLHVYFALAADAAPSAWLPVALRLARLCVEHGFRADSTVTADTARVLRPPGTLHPNGKRVAIIKATGKVYGIEELAQLLGAEVVEEDPFAGARKYDTSVNKEVIAAVELTPKSIFKVVAQCPAMQEAANARGDVPEPFWRAMLGICKFTVEGLEMAHEMSNGHSDYDERETERKYNAYEAGPPTCAEFSKHTKACATCPHAGKIKSPIQLGKMNDAEVAELPVEMQPKEPAPAAAPGMPWDGLMPSRYSVVGVPGKYTLQAIVKSTKEDDTGSTVTSNVVVHATHDIFWFGRVADAADSKDLAQVTVHVFDSTTGQVSDYLMDQSLVASPHDLLKYLAGKGVHAGTEPKAPKAMHDYAKDQLQRIKALAKRPKITGRFGLRIMPSGELVCAMGHYVIYPDGAIHESMLGADLQGLASDFDIPLPPSASGEWDATVWTTDILPRAKLYTEYMKKFYGSPGLAKYQLVAMLGLASPFMAFVMGGYNQGLDLPANGLSVSLYSRESGQGKTALVQAIMLAFGNPEALVKEMNQQGSTDIGRMSRLSTMGTFPTSMEEMGQTKETSITNMISSVANGGGRTRGTREGGFTVGKSWALINLITTNRSQRDMVAVGQSESSAIQQRLLELNVGDVHFERADRDAYASAWSAVKADTKGALGAFINYAACELGHAKLNKLLLECVKKADALLNADQGARFQYRALGALLCLQAILTKAGLAMFDTTTLVEQFREAHANGVVFVEDNILPTDGRSLLSMCLSDLKQHMLITDTDTHGGYQRGEGARYDVVMNSRPPADVKVRFIANTGIAYLSSVALREWCVAHKIEERVLVDDCRDAGVMLVQDTTVKRGGGGLIKQRDLFKGTRESDATRTRVYKIDTRLLNSFDGDAIAAEPAEETAES